MEGLSLSELGAAATGADAAQRTAAVSELIRRAEGKDAAVKAQQDAEKARDDAEKARQDAEKARQVAEKARDDAESAARVLRYAWLLRNRCSVQYARAAKKRA